MIHPDNLAHPDLDLGAREDYPASVVCYFGELEKGVAFAAHSHRRAQLFHIVSGSLTVETARGTFVVPPERAVWIPSGVKHAVTYLQKSALRYLFFRPEAAKRLPDDPSVVRLSPLLRELIPAFMEYARADAVRGPAKRIADVILDQLETVPVLPLHLPMPTSARLRRAVRARRRSGAGGRSRRARRPGGAIRTLVRAPFPVRDRLELPRLATAGAADEGGGMAIAGTQGRRHRRPARLRAAQRLRREFPPRIRRHPVQVFFGRTAQIIPCQIIPWMRSKPGARPNS